MVEEEYEENEESKQMMNSLERVMMEFKSEKKVKIVYHPAPARRYFAPWKFMLDFEIPLVLICDDSDYNWYHSWLIGSEISESDEIFYRKYSHIENMKKDGRVIRNEFCDAYTDKKLDYKNILFYRGMTKTKDGIKDMPGIDVVYVDFLTEYHMYGEEAYFGIYAPIKEILEYCKYINDGGIILLEHYVIRDILKTNPYFKFQPDGSHSRNQFDCVEIEYLGDYNLFPESGLEEFNIDVFRIHSKAKLEDQSDFLKICFE
tara:strand:- start:219 stop:998 length:780 start_codon:yes stop_codon:yes gene_type:complete